MRLPELDHISVSPVGHRGTSAGGRPIEVNGGGACVHFFRKPVRALRHFDGVTAAPELDGVEDKGVEQRREHVHGNHNHAEKDDFLHPCFVDFPASRDAAVPMVDVPREIERPLATGGRQETDCDDADDDRARQSRALIMKLLSLEMMFLRMTPLLRPDRRDE